MNSGRMIAPSRWGRRAVAVAVAVVVGGGGLGALAAPAHAEPSGCVYPRTMWGVQCPEGDGEYRFKMVCWVMNTWPRRRNVVYGPWVKAGPGTSSQVAGCPMNNLPMTKTVEFR